MNRLLLTAMLLAVLGINLFPMVAGAVEASWDRNINECIAFDRIDKQLVKEAEDKVKQGGKYTPADYLRDLDLLRKSYSGNFPTRVTMDLQEQMWKSGFRPDDLHKLVRQKLGSGKSASWWIILILSAFLVFVLFCISKSAKFDRELREARLIVHGKWDELRNMERAGNIYEILSKVPALSSKFKTPGLKWILAFIIVIILIILALIKMRGHSVENQELNAPAQQTTLSEKSCDNDDGVDHNAKEMILPIVFTNEEILVPGQRVEIDILFHPPEVFWEIFHIPILWLLGTARYPVIQNAMS